MKELINRILSFFKKKPTPKIVQMQISTDNGKNWQTLTVSNDPMEIETSNDKAVGWPFVNPDMPKDKVWEMPKED